MLRELASLAFVATLLLPLAAAAQPDGPSAEVREAAREAYGRGQQLFREGRFDESVAAFEEAYRLIPNPVVLVGIAESKERAGDIVGTVETLERYLTARADAPDRAEVQERIDRFRAMPSTLVVSSSPSGAAIVLDGQDADVTPAELEVTPGTHTLAVSIDGYEDHEREVEAVFASRHDVAIELEPVTEAGGMQGEGEAIEEAVDDGPEDEDEDAAGPSVAVWVTTGLAAASLVGGTVLGFMSLSREADFDDTPSEDLADEGERFALFADVLFGIAAVSAITAVVLFLTDGDDEEEDEDGTVLVQVVPVITPHAGGVTAQVRF